MNTAARAQNRNGDPATGKTNPTTSSKNAACIRWNMTQQATSSTSRRKPYVPASPRSVPAWIPQPVPRKLPRRKQRLINYLAFY